jgi:hypothetical protein
MPRPLPFFCFCILSAIPLLERIEQSIDRSVSGLAEFDISIGIMRPPPKKKADPSVECRGPEERTDAIRFLKYPPLSNGQSWRPKIEGPSDERDLTFYFAGKISHTDWRHTLVRDLRNAGLYDDECQDFRRRPILANAIGEGLHYSGPHFNACDHGCAHGPHQHGVLDCCTEDLVPPRRHVSTAAMFQIKRADILFAWLEDLTCYGSLVEIGVARGLEKEIWISWPPEMATIRDGKITSYAPKRDLWFAESLASYTCLAETAKQAFCYFLSLERIEKVF